VGLSTDEVYGAIKTEDGAFSEKTRYDPRIPIRLQKQPPIILYELGTTPMDFRF
jgi:hypothetical protein